MRPKVFKSTSKQYDSASENVSGEAGNFMNDERSSSKELEALQLKVNEHTLENSIQISEPPPLDQGAPMQMAVTKTNEADASIPILGQMNYSFKWQASAPHSNGFIIQRVTRTETVNRADGLQEVTLSWYWEAWTVANNVLFNGDQNISGIQHDSWYNQQMPAGSYGNIQMNCSVYFTEADAIPGMASGTVQMAGNLLSSYNEPGIEKAHVFNHEYNFDWDRRLQGGNIDTIIQHTMAEYVESYGVSDDDDFATVSEEWDDEYWAEFTESINAFDPNVNLTVAAIQGRIAGY